MLNHELCRGGPELRAALPSQPRLYSIAGRKLNAPACTPSGSNGLSSGNGRRLGTWVAIVVGTASVSGGGAPGRFCRRSRGVSGAPGGWSCLGVGPGVATFAAGSAAGVVVPGGCAATSPAPAGFAPCAPWAPPWALWPACPGLVLRLRALLESKPVMPTPSAGSSERGSCPKRDGPLSAPLRVLRKRCGIPLSCGLRNEVLPPSSAAAAFVPVLAGWARADGPASISDAASAPASSGIAKSG